MTQIRTTAPDNPDGTIHTLAPRDIASQICRRFGQRPVALHPAEPNVYVYDPGNFWDGAKHISYDPEFGIFSFNGWDGFQTFPAIGPIR